MCLRYHQDELNYAYLNINCELIKGNLQLTSSSNDWLRSDEIQYGRIIRSNNKLMSFLVKALKTCK